MKCLACALICLPTLALGAERLRDGTYDGFDCAAPMSDQRIVLRGDVIDFYESSCRLSNPVHVREMDGAVLFDAACTGEGERWESRYLLMHARDGGLIVVGSRWAERHARCE
jgi:hypothetical protein